MNLSHLFSHTLARRVFYNKILNNNVIQVFLKQIFGFSTYKLSLYQQAFRHKSSVKEDSLKKDNERLEYLGDAILSAIIADYLYEKFPDKDEGFLTLMRSKIVSRNNLNQLAIKIGINKLIESKLEEETKTKSIYGNTFEALIGAMYVDKGYVFTKKIIYNKILLLQMDMEEIEKTDYDYKSILIKWAQEKKKSVQFKLAKEIGPAHNKKFIINALIDNKIRGKGNGWSKKEAEQIASKEALNSITKEG